MIRFAPEHLPAEEAARLLAHGTEAEKRGIRATIPPEGGCPALASAVFADMQATLREGAKARGWTDLNDLTASGYRDDTAETRGLAAILEHELTGFTAGGRFGEAQA